MARRKIVLKKNTLSGSIPTPSELSIGELAINTADGVIYTKLNDGTISIPIGGSGSGGGGVNIVSWNSITGKPSAFTPSVHSHNTSDITGLAGILTAKADSNNPVFTGTVSGITKVMVGLSNVDNTSDMNKPVSSAQASADENIKTFSIQRNNHTGTQPISSVSGLQTALDNKQNAGSYATLVNGLIPSSQLPSFVDDVLEYESLNLFPNTGSTGKIYVTMDTNKTYRWTGSTYIEISSSPGSTDSIPEGSINKYYTDTRAGAAAPVQSVAGRTGSVTLTKNDVGLNNVDNTSDINKSISNATQNALNLKANINNPNFTGTVTGITQSMVGLSNVDNTRDIDKPVSTAQANINILLQNDATTKANNAQSYAIQRGNHTGTQPLSTIEGLQTELSNKAAVYHTHSAAGVGNNITGVTGIGTNSLEYIRNNTIPIEYRENYSTGIGFDALEDSYGINNTAVGARALKLNTTGIDNSCFGYNAAINNISGPRNVIIGSTSCQNLTTGGGNIGIGFNTMPLLTTGLSNISIGSGGLDGVTVGVDNISLGRFTSVASGTINHSIILGSYGRAENSGELVIGSPERPINTSLSVGPPGGSNVSFLPSKPAGYLFVRLNSGLVRIPFYN